MWKKEISDTLKQTALVLSFLLVIPVVFWINSMRLTDNQTFSHYAGAGIALTLPLLMLYLAYMMFSREDSDNASEYLESLPLSKLKLLLLKVLPRLVAFWFFFIGYSLYLWLSPAQISSNDGFFLIGYSITELVMAAVIPLLAMLSGFLLGISDRRNPVLVAVFFLLVLFPLVPGPLLAISLYDTFLVHNTNHLLSILSMAGVILLIPLLSILPPLSVYGRQRFSSKKIVSQRMLKEMAIPTMLIIASWGLAIAQF